jgi:hypothetical protein
MNTDNHRFSRVAFSLQLSAISLFLSGCNILPQPQPDTTRHFTLSGPVEAGAAADAMQVRPVRLAGHLRNRAMAVRVSANEVIYLDEVRWAEPLDEAITQVLRNRLRQVGGGAAVVVQIQRCELVQSEGNTVQLAATYSITPSGGGDAKTGVFTATARPWSGGDHGILVGLIREAVEELAGAIATAAEK